MKSNHDSAAPRAYRQVARAEAAATTRRRLLDAFVALARTTWIDEITLDAVARDAGTSVQTLIRHYGGKEGLIAEVSDTIGPEIMARRAVPSGALRQAIVALVDDYEITGDFNIRSLAQEQRHPALKRVMDIGRFHHRAWVEHVFGPWLAELDIGARERRIAQLVAICDVYVWQLLRRDMGFEKQAVTEIVTDLAERCVAGQTITPPAAEGKTKTRRKPS